MKLIRTAGRTYRLPTEAGGSLRSPRRSWLYGESDIHENYVAFAILRYHVENDMETAMQTVLVTPHDIGSALRDLRTKKGLTQAELGSRVGLDQQKVSLIFKKPFNN